ncbi:hypothetical protein [Gilvimarinus sp. 1_MG-2023]|uniref:hypothetical protein n=1 Tax=Gilvimarinus sp. 1_MG-2023 TaxID=3062638 RepID=UPI0026E26D5C|nr:hypothetical protein [Gilvimarinus sp. 1_MG-2023]MDO6745612.1 hypothetical protein [Gilvimarinus sp. 1_MG-2023]
MSSTDVVFRQRSCKKRAIVPEVGGYINGKGMNMSLTPGFTVMPALSWYLGVAPPEA